MDTNPHTGDRLVSRVPSQQYKDNYDRIFNHGKKRLQKSPEKLRGKPQKTDKETSQASRQSQLP